jgi:hypothetical protein
VAAGRRRCQVWPHCGNDRSASPTILVGPRTFKCSRGSRSDSTNCKDVIAKGDLRSLPSFLGQGQAENTLSSRPLSIMLRSHQICLFLACWKSSTLESTVRNVFRVSSECAFLAMPKQRDARGPSLLHSLCRVHCRMSSTPAWLARHTKRLMGGWVQGTKSPEQQPPVSLFVSGVPSQCQSR